MIRSFKSKETAKIFNRERSRNFRQIFNKWHYANCECSIALSLCKIYACRLPTD